MYPLLEKISDQRSVKACSSLFPLLCVLFGMRWEFEMVRSGLLTLVCKQVKSGQEGDKTAASPFLEILESLCHL